jgi:hypothetical protein
MTVRVLAAVAVLLIAPAAHAVGEEKDGFPNWAERVELEWTNRARVEPSIEMTKCGAMRCGEASCYTPKPPLYWNENLNRAARFHSVHMKTNGYFAHDSKCTLVSTLNTTYPSTCNGAAACSCAGGTLTGTTSPSARTSIFGAGYSGEIIASPSDPNSAFYLWLYESSSSTTCAFSIPNGHRWLILTSGSGAVGFGVDGNSTGDFGGGGVMSKIASGSHYPRSGPATELWANWYDTAAPKAAMVNVGGTCYPMAKQRGTDVNGAWMYNATGLSGCTRYYFTFKDSAGAQVDYPTTGSLGIGDASCADFSTMRPAAGTGCDCTPSCAGKTCGNDGCGGSCGTCAAGKTCSAAFACVDAPMDAAVPDTSTPAEDAAADTSASADSTSIEDAAISEAAPPDDARAPDDSATTNAAESFEGSCGCHVPRKQNAAPTVLLGLIVLAWRRRR